MANGVITIVFQKAEQVLDSVIAAAVNELNNLGHTVKEVRVMGDTGEVKVPLNTVAGVVVPEPIAPPAAPDVVVPSVPTPPATTSDGVPIDGAPVDTGTTTESDLTIDQQRDALLKQLEDLDAQEEAADAAAQANPTGTGTPAS